MQNYFNAKLLKADSFSQRIILNNDIICQVRKSADNLIQVMREDTEATASGTAAQMRRQLAQWEHEQLPLKGIKNRPAANIGFARVSTQGQDLNAQIRALQAHNCYKIFDWKHSGKARDNQAAINELLNFVIAGDVVLVTKLDRLGRSLLQIVTTINQLSQKGVALHSLDGRIDTRGEDNGLNTLVIAIFGALAELERELIINRTMEGRKISGRWGGRPCKLNLEQRNDVRAKIKQGWNKPQLMKHFEVSKGTILRIQKTKD